MFAILSVATTFFLGLFLAIVFNDPRMREQAVVPGRRCILPYAFPAFLSALVWAGMLNQSFGFINQWFFGGAAIPWLHGPDGWRRSPMLIVNLWLGFPYMFLVCTGALQSIPEEHQRGGEGRRREAVGDLPAASSSRCCWSRWRRC